MLQLIDKRKKIIFYLFLFLLLGTLNTDNRKISSKSSMKIKNIEVFGLSDLDNLKVANDLDLFLLKNIFFLGKKNIENILNKNSLIETFQIKKIYPDTIKVLIIKTEFLAIINREGKNFLIGSNGKETQIKNDNPLNKKLPFIFGKVNYKDFIRLKKLINKSNFQFKQINEFYFFQSQRWDIKTKDGFLIKLPQKNLLKSLQFAYLIKSDDKFKKKKIIDLRVQGKFFNSNE